MKRLGFTLIEMMIAITIFSVVMIFLYQSMATINKSNRFYGDKLVEIKTKKELYKTIFLDLSLSEPTNGAIDNQDRDHDVVLLQTSHVLHTHVMPYVVYFVNNKHLYRVEAATKLTYPFESNINAIIDDFGEVTTFRLYKNSTHFLLHLSTNGNDDNVIKIRHLKAI